MRLPRAILVLSLLALPPLGLLAWLTADHALYGLRAQRVDIRIEQGSADAALLNAAIGYKAYTITYTYTVAGRNLRNSERVSRPMPRDTRTWTDPGNPSDCRMGWMDDLALFGSFLLVGLLVYGTAFRHLLRQTRQAAAGSVQG